MYDSLSVTKLWKKRHIVTFTFDNNTPSQHSMPGVGEIQYTYSGVYSHTIHNVKTADTFTTTNF
jgi:hypothetical protein